MLWVIKDFYVFSFITWLFFFILTYLCTFSEQMQTTMFYEEGTILGPLI